MAFLADVVPTVQKPVQYLSGMGKSKVVGAINKGKDASIFREAGYGIVGDVKEIVSALIRELKNTA